jgi:WD40 repeat protein
MYLTLIFRYNPSETRLAAGSHDNNIYIYDIVDTGYSLFTVLHGHTSYITSLDWSEDGNYIRSNCGSYELLFFDVEGKEQEKSGASNLRSTEWATQNCKLAWNVQGIYPYGTDGSHINGVACLKSKKLIATGDDYGLVNVYNDPCLEGHVGKSYRGHSEHVVRIKFAQDGKYMISAGGYDQTIIQWKREGEDTDEESGSEEEEKELSLQKQAEFDKISESDTDSDEEIIQKKKIPTKPDNKINLIPEDNEDEEDYDNFGSGDDSEELNKGKQINMQNSPAKGFSSREIDPFDASVDSIKKTDSVKKIAKVTAIKNKSNIDSNLDSDEEDDYSVE